VVCLVSLFVTGASEEDFSAHRSSQRNLFQEGLFHEIDDAETTLIARNCLGRSRIQSPVFLGGLRRPPAAQFARNRYPDGVRFYREQKDGVDRLYGRFIVVPHLATG